jgi:hypothetical protein
MTQQEFLTRKAELTTRMAAKLYALSVRRRDNPVASRELRSRAGELFAAARAAAEKASCVVS